ncbi:MAG: hypothetical protein WBQ25_12690 [Nitrososphaeraceae archaeon]
MAGQPDYHAEDTFDKQRQQTKVISTKVSVDQYRRFKLLTEYLSQKGLAHNHTPSAVLRNHIEDLLRHYYSEVDGSTDGSKDLSNTSGPDTALLSPSPEEERQENQEEVIHHNESAYDEMPQSTINYVLEEIMSRYGTKLNYNIMNEDRLEVLSRANELSRRVSVDLLQKIENLAEMAKAIIDMFDRIYEVAKQEGYPIDEIVEDKEKLKEFLGFKNIN